MRLRIIRPLPDQLEGFALGHLAVGVAYDINVPLSDVLLATGYAIPEEDHSLDRAAVLKALGDALVTGDTPKTRSKRRLKKR